jgi:hypothetical protein
MSGAAARASVLGGDGGYEMFDVVEIDDRGARLVGPLLLEVGEEITLRLAKGGADVELRARVTRVERGEREAATLVTFVI